MESYLSGQDMQSNVEEIVNAKQLEEILNSSTAEVSKWCRKACLKPKKDAYGNIYFSKSDIDVLKKVKELYESTRIYEEKKQKIDRIVERLEREEKMKAKEKQNNSPVVNISDGNFLTRAKSKYTRENAVSDVSNYRYPNDLSQKIDNLENNIVSKISNLLSEKMDGLDEIVVELIRSKTENETLRARLNELNKENFSLKTENASYKPVGLGFYVKKNTDDFVL